VFHASLLTPYKETNEHGTNFLEPPLELIEGEEEWEIEQILGKRHFGKGKKLQYLVRWKDYSPAHDQWVDKSDITADDLVTIYERENREERPPRRSIRTPRKKTNETICSLRISSANNHYHQHMTSNAGTIDTQQVHADSSHSTTKIQTSQTTLPPIVPAKSTLAAVDVAVFAGTNDANPVQARDRTPALSFVPIGGTFTYTNNTTPQTEPMDHPANNEDREDHAPSPLTLSPTSPQPEKSTSLSPIPIPPRPQHNRQSGTDSPRSSMLPGTDPDRERHGQEAMSTLWRRVKALHRYHAAHQRQYPGGFSLPGLAKTTIMVKRLTEMPEPPQSLADFMTDIDIRYRRDEVLAKGLQIVLPQLAEYLGMDDS